MAVDRLWARRQMPVCIIAALLGFFCLLGLSRAGESLLKLQPAPAAVSDADFQRILSACAQCHRAKSQSVQSAIDAGRIQAGDPERSLMFRQISNMHMKAATRLGQKEADAVYKFIKNLQPDKNTVAPKIPAAGVTPAAPLTADEHFKQLLGVCAQCHRGKFDTVAVAIDQGWIEPGDPEKSRFYRKIMQSSAWNPKMQEAVHLTDADKTAVADYIKNMKALPVAEAPKLPAPAVTKAAAAGELNAEFKASFRNLTVPTGAMTADREEMLLRYQARSLAHEIAFLCAVARLEVSKDQAQQLLPVARKARDLCEDRAVVLRDACKAYGIQCDAVRNNNIMVVTGCDRDQIQRLIGEQWGMCGPPGYGLGSLDHPVREKFFVELAALAKEADSAGLSAAQKELLPAIEKELAWTDLLQTRRAIWSFVTDRATAVPVAPIGRLLMSPIAVAWLEKAAGLDAAASIKHEQEIQPLGADLTQRYRDMGNRDLRIVDGGNVISGMNFSDQQLTTLINVLRGEVAEIHAAHAEANKKNLRPLVTLLTQMRDDTAAGKELAPEKIQKVLEYQKGICRGNYVHVADNYYSVLCPIHKDYTQKMEAVLKRLEDGSLIDVAQAKLLYDTSQCDWFPPKNYRDPVRVGQAAKTIVYPEHDVIARLKGLSDTDYPKERDAFARTLAAATLAKNANDAARQTEAQRLGAALDKLRDMPEALYELNKYDLLSDLLKKPCPEKTSGTGAEYPNNGDIQDLTWDTRFIRAPYQWSYWDFMQAMKKAGKPLPSFLDKPVPYEAYGNWAMSLQEWPAFFLMDPDVVPALETLRVIVRNPPPGQVADLDKLVEKVQKIEDLDAAALDHDTPAGKTPAFYLRIHCGTEQTSKGADYKDPFGNLWQAERPYVKGDWGYVNAVGGGGHWHPAGNPERIENTTMEPLYRSERHDIDRYCITVPENGSYIVKLHFAENFDHITSPGQRVFSICMGGKEAIKDLDVYGEVGSYAALVKKVQTEVTDGVLTIEFKKTKGAWGPMINAIQVISTKTK